MHKRLRTAILEAADYLDLLAKIHRDNPDGFPPQLDAYLSGPLSDKLCRELAVYDDEREAIEREAAEYVARPRTSDNPPA